MAKPQSETFPGFPRELVGFLKELRDNNDKTWFEAHRTDYEALLVAPAQAFVAAMAGIVAAFEPPLGADPRTNSSLRRIHRDTRFSADKRPFHDQLHVIFWAGERPNHGAGVHFVIGPDSLGFGAGQWGFEGDGSQINLVLRHRYDTDSSATQALRMLTEPVLNSVAVGTTYQVVAKIQMNSVSGDPRGNDLVSVWVNPGDITNEAAAGAPTAQFVDFSLNTRSFFHELVF
ncbi:MAG TPA: DUF2461 family protein, partial [Hyphomicrobiales bacterium]|nr:DUF2461 family protein [Hyphomicrobiales bacterium]